MGRRAVLAAGLAVTALGAVTAALAPAGTVLLVGRAGYAVAFLVAAGATVAVAFAVALLLPRRAVRSNRRREGAAYRAS